MFYCVYIHIRFTTVDEVLRNFVNFEVTQCRSYLDNDVDLHLRIYNYLDILKLLDICKQYRIIDFSFHLQK